MKIHSHNSDSLNPIFFEDIEDNSFILALRKKPIKLLPHAYAGKAIRDKNNSDSIFIYRSDILGRYHLIPNVVYSKDFIFYYLCPA